MAVNLKLGVELGDFQQNINTAKAQIREFDAALKQAESRFKATGDAESAMATKTSQLTAKFQAQKRMVEEYRQALQKADEKGVSKLNSEYIKLQTQLLNAEAAMYDTQTALQGLSMSEQQAAQGADQLTKSVNGIGKKISLEQVIGGIDKITGGLENAARRAVQLGEQLWDMIMDSAQRADDQATMAEMYNIPLQRYKQMLALEKNGLDTTTDAILSSQKKLSSNIGKGNNATLDTLRELGLLFETGKGAETFITTDQVEMFWKAGQAMMALGESFDKEAAAQSLFGRSWNELVPLFTKYKSLDEYEQALGEVNITSEETTENLAELSDKVGKLQNTWTTLKDEIIGAVAPGLTKASEALNDMLSTILEYLKSENGQAMLEKLGESVAGLFDDLSKVNPEDVVNNFVTIFDKLTNGLEWLDKHWSDVVTGLEAIGIAFGGLKIAEGVLEFVRLVQGARGLTGGAGASVVASAMPAVNKLAFNGIESTLGTNIGGAIASVLTSTPLTVAIAAASIAALAHGIYVAMNNKNPIEQMAASAGFSEERTKEIIESIPNTYNPFDTKQTNEVTNLIKNILTGGKTKPDNDLIIEIVEEAAEEVPDQIGDVMITIDLIAPADAAEDIEKQIGTVTVPATLDWRPSYQQGYPQQVPGWGGHANGLPWVENEGLYLLHRGERVLTASENRNYTFNNNTYFGSVNLNNGTQVEQLAEAISRNNRKQSRAYGS